MKRIVLLLAVFALGLSAASFAVATPPPGQGKDKNRGSSTAASTTALDPETCHPKISVILKGDFVSGAGDSFTMDVKQANYHGHDLVGSPLTLKVDDKTSFKRNGPATLADFKAGDRLNVQARACKAKKNAPKDPNAAPPALLAKRVTGHPAQQSGSDSEGGDSGTTTTTP
jgi:opacity protein-like surface antigen